MSDDWKNQKTAGDQFKDIENYAKDIGDSDEKLRLGEIHDLSKKWRTTGERLADEEASRQAAAMRTTVEDEFRSKAIGAGATDVDDLIKRYGERGSQISGWGERATTAGAADVEDAISRFKQQGEDIAGWEEQAKGEGIGAANIGAGLGLAKTRGEELVDAGTKYGDLETEWKTYQLGGAKDYYTTKREWDDELEAHKATKALYGEGGAKDYYQYQQGGDKYYEGKVGELADKTKEFEDIQRKYEGADSKYNYADLESQWKQYQQGGDKYYEGKVGELADALTAHQATKDLYGKGGAKDYYQYQAGGDKDYADTLSQLTGKTKEFEDIQRKYEGEDSIYNYAAKEKAWADYQLGGSKDYAALQQKEALAQAGLKEYGVGGAKDYAALQQDLQDQSDAFDIKYGDLQGLYNTSQLDLSDVQKDLKNLKGDYTGLQSDYQGIEDLYGKGGTKDYEALSKQFSDLTLSSGLQKGELEGLQEDYDFIKQQYGAGGTHDYNALLSNYHTTQGSLGKLQGEFEGYQAGVAASGQGTAPTNQINDSRGIQQTDLSNAGTYGSNYGSYDYGDYDYGNQSAYDWSPSGLMTTEERTNMIAGNSSNKKNSSGVNSQGSNMLAMTG